MMADSSTSMLLHETLMQLIPKEKERLGRMKQEQGHIPLGSYTILDTISGSRGIKSILWDVSLLDPQHGILFRGFSVPRCLAELPAPSHSTQPLPEGLLWLFLTGNIPAKPQLHALCHDLRSRAAIPHFVFNTLNALPVSAHPMTQLVSGIMALQVESHFQTAYEKGTPVSKLWEVTLQDCLDLIARLPILAAFIYRRSYKDGGFPIPDPELDHAANFCHMLGYHDRQMFDLMRVYFIIHSDHEGGAVSAHAVRLVGSALSDPYRAFAAGVNGIAGPLHGLAIQEAFRWVKQVASDLGSDATEEQLQTYVWETLNAGKIIPGFGHSVLKTKDQRYEYLLDFCKSNLPDDPLFNLLSRLGEVVPRVMKQHGKVRNPWPNVDAIIGVVFNHFGLTEESFFTVLLSVARSIGVLSQLVWDRALGLPIERPKSISMDWIEDYCKTVT